MRMMGRPATGSLPGAVSSARPLGERQIPIAYDLDDGVLQRDLTADLEA
jgi:hypothetical protein